jgi:acylglycerol lipase
MNFFSGSVVLLSLVIGPQFSFAALKTRAAVPDSTNGYFKSVTSQMKEDSDGKDLYYKVKSSGLATEEIEEIFVIVHGLKDHIGRYDELSEHLMQAAAQSQKPIEVWGYDQPHHGHSGILEVPDGEVPTGEVDSIAENVEHLHNFLTLVSQGRPGRPILLFGHSMGGLAVASYVARYGNEIPLRGVILSAPSLKLFGGVWSTLRQSTLKLFSGLIPAGTPAIPDFLPNDGFFDDRMNSPVENIQPFNKAQKIAEFVSDPFIHSGFHTIGTALALIRGMDSLQAQVGSLNSAVVNKFDVPFLIFHAQGDQITNPQGSQDFYNFIKHANLPHSSTQSEYHEIHGVRFHNLPELYGDNMIPQILNWDKSLQ